MLLNVRFTADSNPSLSATQSRLQRNRAVILQQSLKIAAIPRVLSSNRTRESVPANLAGKFSGAFLWRAHAQSDFTDSIRRMQCDHTPIMRRKRLDFVSSWECRFFSHPFVGSFPLVDAINGGTENSLDRKSVVSLERERGEFPGGAVEQMCLGPRKRAQCATIPIDVACWLTLTSSSARPFLSLRRLLEVCKLCTHLWK